jgi:hypothetical protein
VLLAFYRVAKLFINMNRKNAKRTERFGGPFLNGETGLSSVLQEFVKLVPFLIPNRLASLLIRGIGLFAGRNDFTCGIPCLEKNLCPFVQTKQHLVLDTSWSTRTGQTLDISGWWWRRRRQCPGLLIGIQIYGGEPIQWRVHIPRQCH